MFPPQLQSLLPFQQHSPTEAVKEDYGLNGSEPPTDLFTYVRLTSYGRTVLVCNVVVLAFEAVQMLHRLTCAEIMHVLFGNILYID